MPVTLTDTGCLCVCVVFINACLMVLRRHQHYYRRLLLLKLRWSRRRRQCHGEIRCLPLLACSHSQALHTTSLLNTPYTIVITATAHDGAGVYGTEYIIEYLRHRSHHSMSSSSQLSRRDRCSAKWRSNTREVTNHWHSGHHAWHGFGPGRGEQMPTTHRHPGKS